MGKEHTDSWSQRTVKCVGQVKHLEAGDIYKDKCFATEANCRYQLFGGSLDSGRHVINIGVGFSDTRGRQTADFIVVFVICTNRADV